MSSSSSTSSRKPSRKCGARGCRRVAAKNSDVCGKCAHNRDHPRPTADDEDEEADTNQDGEGKRRKVRNSVADSSISDAASSSSSSSSSFSTSVDHTLCAHCSSSEAALQMSNTKTKAKSDDEDEMEDDEDEEEEEELHNRSFPISAESRFSLPPSVPQFRAVLRMVLQDLNPAVYNIPFIQDHILDLIADYTIEVDSDPPVAIQAFVVKLPKGVLYSSSLDKIIEAPQRNYCYVSEYHSERQIRARLAMREVEIREAAACTYFQLDGEEMQEMRDTYSIPKPPDDFRQNLRSEWRTSDAHQFLVEHHVTVDVQRLAATRMAQLLISSERTPEDQRTPAQKLVRESGGQWRRELLQFIQQRTVQLRAPLAEAIKLGVINNPEPHLYSLTEFVPATGEIVTTARMGPVEQSPFSTGNHKVRTLVQDPAMQTFRPSLPHSRRKAPVITASQLWEHQNLDPPPF